MKMIKELEQFHTVGLYQMDNVKLMDRKECKFTIPTQLVPELLTSLKDDYNVLKINDQTVMAYQSHYYDSPDFGFYTSHQNGKLNRYKIRRRIYHVSGIQFLEIKFKNNKRRTIKKRIEMGSCQDLAGYSGFIQKNLPQEFSSLEEKLQVDYNRITLVDKNWGERITIDLNLLFSSGIKKTDYRNMAVIEIKYDRSMSNSPMKKALDKMGIKPFSLSKYCLGISQHYPQVKQNRMKVKVRELIKEINKNAC